jgi:hypothetical protein
MKQEAPIVSRIRRDHVNIDDLSASLGESVSVNILHPSPGDLLVLKVDVALSPEQRDRIHASIVPLLEGCGCKAFVLEKGYDVELIKRATEVTDVGIA